MKAKQKWAVWLTMLGLFVVLDASAFFDPTIGRWVSRDPVEERGGVNLYGFVMNRPIGNTDTLGLLNEPISGFLAFDPQYSSEGRVLRDPDIIRSPLYPQGGTALYSSSESGLQADPSAYYSQTAVGLMGGLCNSGDPEPSSFVKASVINRGRCCMRMRFTCTASFVGIKWRGAVVEATGRPIPGNFRVVGKLLGKDVVPTDTRELSLQIGWLTSMSVFSKTESKELNMNPNAKHSLYELSAPIAFDVGNRWGGFTESMTATCSATIVGPCND